MTEQDNADHVKAALTLFLLMGELSCENNFAEVPMHDSSIKKILTVDDNEDLRQDPRLADIPVVMMTANGHLISVMERVEEARPFMSKPMDYDDVVKMVKHFLKPELARAPAL